MKVTKILQVKVNWLRVNDIFSTVYGKAGYSAQQKEISSLLVGMGQIIQLETMIDLI